MQLLRSASRPIQEVDRTPEPYLIHPMNNTITVNDKEYNRDELSQEVNHLIDHITFVQGECQRQQAFIEAADLGRRVLFDQLSEKLEAEVPSKPGEFVERTHEGDLVSKSLSLDSDVEEY